MPSSVAVGCVAAVGFGWWEIAFEQFQGVVDFVAVSRTFGSGSFAFVFSHSVVDEESYRVITKKGTSS